ncbi:MAG: 50S ribosomal protein L31 [Chloroflexi bacterium]|nr:50S ribosomal protein L31 [Chloroflexota bacterium]
MAKKDIQPKYYPNAKISCSCKNVIEVGATQPEIKVEMCSQCHPYYTGESRMVDTAGRVERFNQRYAKKK